MKKRHFPDRVTRVFKSLYLKLFRINDSPQKIALGFGLGVFLGIVPGAGPIASLVLAMVFRVNRAAALLGCVLTNTWISVVAFLFSVKVGALITGADAEEISAAVSELAKNFQWADLFNISVVKVGLPLVVGYLATAFLFAVISSVVVFVAVTRTKSLVRSKKARSLG